jgi:hypothetical protein
MVCIFFKAEASCRPCYLSGTCHNRTVPSSELEAIVLPSGEKVTLFTLSVCPFTARSNAPSATHHQRMPYDALPAANIFPSGEKATLPIPPFMDFISRMKVQSSTLQSC